MIDDGVGLSLTPWWQVLEQQTAATSSAPPCPAVKSTGRSHAARFSPLQASQGVNYFTLKGSQQV
jgi:hypothetical protein